MLEFSDMRVVTVGLLSLFLLGLIPARTSLLAQKRSVWDGVYTAEQAARGEKSFSRSCGGCHRDDASGGDDSEPPLRGQNFTPNWEDASIAGLYDFIATNMPRNKPGSLPLPECVDIVAFLLKLNGMPPGQTELPTDMKILSAIQFTAARLK